jgi:hypothetical protein
LAKLTTNPENLNFETELEAMDSNRQLMNEAFKPEEAKQE